MYSIAVIICMGCKRNHNEIRDVAFMAEKCGAKQVIGLSLSQQLTDSAKTKPSNTQFFCRKHLLSGELILL